MSKSKGLQRFDFNSFAKKGNPVDLGDCLNVKQNISRFLDSLGSKKSFNLKPVSSYQVILMKKEREIPLYVFIDTTQKICSYCEETGIHSYSNLYYHIVIPKSKKTLGPEFLVDSEKFLLHGVFHDEKGIGHLLRVNGIEGGSQVLFGRQLMSLWNRMCDYLKISLITCKDNAVKKGMDLRLLYGIAYGHSWTGKWDYKPMNGIEGFRVTEYYAAISRLCSINLDDMILTLDNGHVEAFTNTVRKYRKLSDGRLSQLSDLLKFMLSIRVLDSVAKKNGDGGDVLGVDRRKMVCDDVLLVYNAITNSIIYQNEVAVITGPKTYFAKVIFINRAETIICMVCNMPMQIESPPNRETDTLLICDNCNKLPNDIVEIAENDHQGDQIDINDNDDDAEVFCFQCGMAQQRKDTFLGYGDQLFCGVCFMLTEPE